MLECAMAIENGADELDTVINVGAILSGDYDLAESELAMMREEIDGEALLKVILETGSLAGQRCLRWRRGLILSKLRPGKHRSRRLRRLRW